MHKTKTYNFEPGYVQAHRKGEAGIILEGVEWRGNVEHRVRIHVDTCAMGYLGLQFHQLLDKMQIDLNTVRSRLRGNR